MEAAETLKAYADSLGGHFMEYSDTRSIAIIPVPGGRTQTVTCEEFHNQLYNRKLLRFCSKVCTVGSGLDFPMILEQASFFNYCRFVIRNGELEVETIADPATGDRTIYREMVMEVANLADQYEMKLSGKDAN